MHVSKQQLQDAIKRKLDPTHVDIEDMSDDCGAKYQVTIVSERFEGKTLLQRHQLVNEALKEEIAKMHAFSQVMNEKERMALMVISFYYR
jgi:stress-induced morphogen